jgi:hypothetical protein
MTWKQFKEAVEAAGVADGDKLFYIDTGNHPRAEDLEVRLYPVDKGDGKEFLVSC